MQYHFENGYFIHYSFPYKHYKQPLLYPTQVLPITKLINDNKWSITLFILVAGIVLNVLSRLALTPGGGSNTNTRPARSRFTGSLGVISIVRKRRKLTCGVSECSFFSSCTNQLGARCTFFNITQRPDLVAALITLSARLKPSAEPVQVAIVMTDSV